MTTSKDLTVTKEGSEVTSTDQSSGQNQLTLSLEDSPVRTSPTPARVRVSKVSGRDYGQSSPVLLAKYDPDTPCWRTSQRCLVEGWTVLRETWPRSGMTVNGTAYQLPPLVRLTAGTGSGLFATPAAVEYGTNQGGAMGRVGPVRPSLSTMARKDLWPTPNVPNGGRTVHHVEWQGRTAYHKGKKVQVGLEAAVKMCPTPTSMDGKRGVETDEARKARGAKTGTTLNDFVAMVPTPDANCWKGGARKAQLTDPKYGVTPNGGQLNPTWVEWLMGFPPGWTDLED